MEGYVVLPAPVADFPRLRSAFLGVTMLPGLARMPSSAQSMRGGVMTKSERQTILKSGTLRSQKLLCKTCYVKETGDTSAQATFTGMCYKCKSGPTGVIPWRSDTVHSVTSVA